MKIDAVKVHELGFVELVDTMGDDAAIVQAARVSFNRDEEDRTIQEDRSLIRYLMRNRHTTPFEMVELKFHLKMTIREARQWVRHRTASMNEISGRYVALPEEFYVPAPERVQGQSKSNRQGSSAEQLADASEWAKDFREEAVGAFVAYRQRVDAGMALELARSNLPLSTYTRFYWKIDLHNLLHFLGLRMDGHAQSEIRDYANVMASMVMQLCPIAWEAFEDFRLGAKTLSRHEWANLQEVIRTSDAQLQAPHNSFPTKREREEFIEKMRLLGVVVPADFK